MSNLHNSAEIARLKALHEYQVLDTALESDFDNITTLAAVICDAPNANITFIDQNRVWVKSTTGLAVSEINRNEAFCAQAALQNTPYILQDTLKSPQFANNAMVVNAPYIRFYAGFQLICPLGHVIGMLSVTDSKPRVLNQQQINGLTTLATQVMVLLENRRQNRQLEVINAQLSNQTQALEKKTEFLSTLLESLSEGIVACDENGELSLLNHTMIAMHGSTSEATTPLAWANKFELFMPDDNAPNGMTKISPTDSPLYRAFNGEHVKQQTLIIIPKGQAPRTLLCNGQAILNAQGEKLGAVIAMQDVTAEKQALAEQRIYLDRLNNIADRLPGMIFEYHRRPDGSSFLPYASSGMQAIFGVAPQDVAEDVSASLQLTHPEDMDGVLRSLDESAAHLSLWQHEYRICTSAGETKWLNANAMPQKAADGTIIWHGFLYDVTRLHQSNTQLTLLENAVSRINDVILITEAEPIDGDGPKVVYVNDAFEKHTGYTREEILGNTPRILQGKDSQRSELARIRHALTRWQTVRAELLNYKKSGEEFWVELDIVPVANKDGWFTHWISVQRDISERKKIEHELLRLNRALQLRTHLSDLIAHASDEQQLLQQSAQLALDIGGYCTSWIGYAENDNDKSITPVAIKGKAADAVNALKFSWAGDVPAGLGPAGHTIRNGLTIACENLSNDALFARWMPIATEYGLNGSIYLPLKDKTKTFGLLSLYMDEIRSIPDDEIMLLEMIANDLAFALSSFRAKESQSRVQSAITKLAGGVSAHANNTFFEQLNRNIADALSAEGAIISMINPNNAEVASTLSVIVNGKVADNFDYLIAQTPCRNLLNDDVCVIKKAVADDFPASLSLKGLGIQAYVGHSLKNAAGALLGFIFLLFKSRLDDATFITSTLTLFATRVASELERLAAEKFMRQQASLLDKAQDAILVQDLSHQVLYWNKSAERMYGWTALELTNKAVDSILFDDLAQFKLALAHVIEHGEWHDELNQRHKNGALIVTESRWTLVRDDFGEPTSILSINTDITARKADQEKIQQLAFYDSLTKLPNRQLLTDRLQQVIAATVRHQQMSAILFIDLDNFKALNDTLGHSVGDLLLIEVANRLKSNVRECDTVSRLGGDEFVVTLTELSSIKAKAAEQAQRITEKLMEKLNKPYRITGHTHLSSPSIGITLISDTYSDVDMLLKQADLAMYQAKAAGRNTLRFYEEAMQVAITNKVALEADLRRGLRHAEFILHYQPQLNHQQQMIGVEALIRWQHPTRGMVPPLDFIPLAEETRLIIPIGLWVLETACKQLVAWAKHPDTQHLTVSVNISAHQIRDAQFVDKICALIDETGVNSNQLELELTESIFIDNVEDIIEKMNALKARGVGFSLDDFGTGYSSLSYLKRLPLDQLKIDQSFVRDVLTDNNAATIAKSIVNLGKSLGLEIVAEGVETPDQKTFLLDNNCFIYQGYLFSKPLPIEGLEVFMATRLREIT